MKKIVGIFCGLAVMSVAGMSNAQITNILTDDFESYADQTAVQAVYTAAAGTGGTVATAPQLVTNAGLGEGGSDKYINLLGLSSWRLHRNLPSTHAVTDADPINLSYYVYAPSTPTNANANSRQGVSVRATGAGVPILQIGTTNAATSNGTGAENKYAVRVVAGGGGWTGAPNYFTLLTGPDRVNDAWTKLAVTGGDTTVTASVNDGTAITVTTALTATGPTIGNVHIGQSVTNPVDYQVDSIVVSHGIAVSAVEDWQLL